VDVLRHQIDLEVVLPEGCDVMTDEAEPEHTGSSGAEPDGDSSGDEA
jgi:hypothetical protein